MHSRNLLFVFVGGLMVFIGTKCLKKDNPKSSGTVISQLDTIIQSGDRDSSLVNADASDITKVEWSNAAGRKESLSKEDFVWHYAGMEALDPARSEQYFRHLTNLRGSDLSPRHEIAGLEMKETITLFGNNMIAPIKLTAYVDPLDAHIFLIHSSDNPGNIFISDSSGIYQRIFGDLRQFWPDGQ